MAWESYSLLVYGHSTFNVDDRTYRREMGGFPLEEINTQSHAIAVKSVCVIQTPVMREQLLPHNVSEMGE
jgi:hypothetical protein